LLKRSEREFRVGRLDKGRWQAEFLALTLSFGLCQQKEKGE